MAWRVSLSPVRMRAAALGIKNPRQLHLRAGIDYRTATRWWFDDPTMTRLETDVMLKLAKLLECKTGDLITEVYLGDQNGKK